MGTKNTASKEKAESSPRHGNKVLIGENSLIADSAVLEDDIHIGNNITIGPGCHLCGGMRVEDDCRIASGVVFTRESGGNDSPRTNALLFRRESPSAPTRQSAVCR